MVARIQLISFLIVDPKLFQREKAADCVLAAEKWSPCKGATFVRLLCLESLEKNKRQSIKNTKMQNVWIKKRNTIIPWQFHDDGCCLGLDTGSVLVSHCGAVRKYLLHVREKNQTNFMFYYSYLM